MVSQICKTAAIAMTHANLAIAIAKRDALSGPKVELRWLDIIPSHGPSPHSVFPDALECLRILGGPRPP